MKFIYILILFFTLLITYQMITNIFYKNNTIEGLENNDSTNSSEYKPYNLNDPNNALILPQQNAGNIEVLKGRINNFDGVKQQVDTMQQSIDSMQTQIDSLVQQQADFAQEMAGSTPPTITGTGIDDEEEI
jgi:hypothetical protein